MVCWWNRLDLRLYVVTTPLVVCEKGSNCVSFGYVLFVTVDYIGLMVDGSVFVCLEGVCLVSLSMCRVMFVLARFVMFCSRFCSAISLPPHCNVTVGFGVLIL